MGLTEHVPSSGIPMMYALRQAEAMEANPICVCGHGFLSHKEISKPCGFVYSEHEQILNRKPVPLTIRCGCQKFEAESCYPYDNM